MIKSIDVQPLRSSENGVCIILIPLKPRTIFLAGVKAMIEPLPKAVFDLKKLKSGDEILVDFVVRTSADAPLRAAGIWMK